MKIGILTYFRSHNYGSYLQGYALTMYLRQLGYDAELINFNMTKAAERFSSPKLGKDPFRFYYRRKNYISFEDNLLLAPCDNKLLISDSVEDLREKIYGKYDLLIVGSDEIWKTDNFRGFPNPYWLPGDFGCPKCAYAVSSLSEDSCLTDIERQQLLKFVTDFDYLSVRDKYTYDKLKKIVGNNKKVFCVSDPTFMYDFKVDKQEGRKLLCRITRANPKNKIIGFMSSDKKLAKTVKQVVGKEGQVIALYDYMLGMKNTLCVTPMQWYKIIAGLDLMVTSYFHGTCFSIIESTPFVSFDCSTKNYERSKIYQLLNQCGLLNRFILGNKIDSYDRAANLIMREINSKEEFCGDDVIRKFRKLNNSFEIYLRKIEGSQRNEK